MKIIKILALLLALTPQTTYAKNIEPTAAELLKSELKVIDIDKLLPCAPRLISRFAKNEIERKKFSDVHYLGFEFTRTDIANNEPDGVLTVNTLEKNPKQVMLLNLSLNDRIYFSARLGIMVIENQSGSSHGFNLYELTSVGSSYIGTTNSDEQATNYLNEVLSLNNSSTPMCGK